MNKTLIIITIIAGTLSGAFFSLVYTEISPRQEEGAPPVWTADSLNPEMGIDKAVQNEEILPETKEVNTERAVQELKPVQEPGIEAEEEEKKAAVIKPKENPLPKAPDKTPIPHNNKELDNYNIMFFGIEDDKLQMLTVYSINKDNNWKSGTVFLPTDTLVPGTESMYLAEYFYRYGVEEVKQLVEREMEIKINYYVKVDRNLLLEVEPYLDPIYIDGEKVNLAQLFTKEITPEDEIILAALLKNLTMPSVYFGVLPKLVITCKQYITTDFELNWTNLWVHYQIAKNIDTTAVTKRIISGGYRVLNNKRYWIPTREAWWNMVYRVTN